MHMIWFWSLIVLSANLFVGLAVLETHVALSKFCFGFVVFFFQMKKLEKLCSRDI